MCKCSFSLECQIIYFHLVVFVDLQTKKNEYAVTVLRIFVSFVSFDTIHITDINYIEAHIEIIDPMNKQNVSTNQQTKNHHHNALQLFSHLLLPKIQY